MTAMKRILLLFALACLFTGCTEYRNPDVAPYGCFAEGKIADITPEGWLKEFLERQVDGMTGHPESMSYPYNTSLWAGVMKRNTDTYGQDWWRYEQTAYYTDGLLKTGILLEDQDLANKAWEGIRYTIENAGDDGLMGPDGYWGHWPFVVFFRVLQAAYEAEEDPMILEAVKKHYTSLIESGFEIGKHHAVRKKPWRNIMNVEGILWLYARTGDKALLDYAVEQWDAEEGTDVNMSEMMSDRRPYFHGVTYSETMKIPMLLYAYTGIGKYLDAALRADEKLQKYHMLPDGVPSGCEYLSGNDPILAHETCDITDYTWSLGHYLMTTGDGRWADAIEKAVFNAGPGSVTKDFKALQYFSCVNQFIATGNSDHNVFKKGRTWMAYRPTHETECCAGNVHRIMPNYISRMWLDGTAEGELVAALYGPSKVSHRFPDGRVVTVEERTGYPFDGDIKFVFKTDKAVKFPFTFRIPQWCKDFHLTINGEELDVMPGEDGFCTIVRRFRDGDEICLTLDMPVEVKQWTKGEYVQRGPVLYSYAIPTTWEEDTKEYPFMHGKVPEHPDFKCWNITPAGEWNYTMAGEPQLVKTGHAGYPFDLETVPYKIQVPVSKVKDWVLVDGIHTPPVPEEFTVDNSLQIIELVPYGATTLRLTVFPHQ